MDFFQNHHPRDLLTAYGSPLYVYNENIFREKCRDMMQLSPYPGYVVNYAIKANTNISLLAIAREEGLRVDVCSPGEIIAAERAGYTSEEILFIANNVSAEELLFAVKRDITVSVDSLSLLDKFGRVNPGGRVAVRFNAGIGGGHHEKVITGGDHTKFGILPAHIPQIKALLHRYDLQLIGINHHIGSQNMGDLYLAGVEGLLDIARQFEDLEFIDFGGGLGIPYRKKDGEKPPNLTALGEALTLRMTHFAAEYGKPLIFMNEPGRYICAESGVLLGTVQATKTNGTIKYVGTDLGFSVFARTTLYEGTHHDIEVFKQEALVENMYESVHIVGNMCESGDYIAKDCMLPLLAEGDVLAVMDAGAYGYAMASTYNQRLRPAEILICADGTLKLIRRRDNYEDLLRNMETL